MDTAFKIDPATATFNFSRARTGRDVLMQALKTSDRKISESAVTSATFFDDRTTVVTLDTLNSFSEQTRPNIGRPQTRNTVSTKENLIRNNDFAEDNAQQSNEIEALDDVFERTRRNIFVTDVVGANQGGGPNDEKPEDVDTSFKTLDLTSFIPTFREKRRQEREKGFLRSETGVRMPRRR